jgi:hypothetical protein
MVNRGELPDLLKNAGFNYVIEYQDLKLSFVQEYRPDFYVYAAYKEGSLDDLIYSDPSQIVNQPDIPR